MEEPQEKKGFSIYFLFVHFFLSIFCVGSFFLKQEENIYCQKEMTLEWNLQKFSQDLSSHELSVQNFSQHLSLNCILTSGIYLSPFFSNGTILGVVKSELLSVPPQFVSSPWALNQEGRTKRPGQFFSGTVQACALAQWQKAAKDIFGPSWGCATFFMQNKQSEIFHQGILQAHYPAWWQPVCIP